jgi:hypothetical protein
MENSKFIVKIQVPLASSDDMPPFLVYDKAKDFQDIIDDPGLKRKIKIALSGEAKGYFWMLHQDGEYLLDLNTIVLHQPW